MSIAMSPEEGGIERDTAGFWVSPEGESNNSLSWFSSANSYFPRKENNI